MKLNIAGLGASGKMLDMEKTDFAVFSRFGKSWIGSWRLCRVLGGIKPPIAVPCFVDIPYSIFKMGIHKCSGLLGHRKTPTGRRCRLEDLGEDVESIFKACVAGVEHTCWSAAGGLEAANWDS